MRRMDFFFAAIAVMAFLGAVPCHALDRIVEKKTFVLPSYTTVGGAAVKNVAMGYETYGTLDAAKDNAVLVPPFFAGTSHVAGKYKAEDKFPGYWDAITGPGKPLDTSRYFIIGVDSLCNTSTKDGMTVTTGPASTDPDTGKPYGMRFPVVQIRDMVNVEKALLDSLGIKRLHAVMGLSLGAFQTWEWAAAYPAMVPRIVPVVGSPASGPYQIATIQNWANPILADPAWKGGDYGDAPPLAGLTAAFQLVAVQTRQPAAFAAFGRKPADPAQPPAASYDNKFAVQAWVDGYAHSLAETSDAGNFVCLVRAIELFQAGDKPTLAEGLQAIKAKILMLPDAHDQLLLPEYSRAARDLLRKLHKRVEYRELAGPDGHLDSIFHIGQASAAIARFLASD